MLYEDLRKAVIGDSREMERPHVLVKSSASRAAGTPCVREGRYGLSGLKYCVLMRVKVSYGLFLWLWIPLLAWIPLALSVCE